MRLRQAIDSRKPQRHTRRFNYNLEPTESFAATSRVLTQPKIVALDDEITHAVSTDCAKYFDSALHENVLV